MYLSDNDILSILRQFNIPFEELREGYSVELEHGTVNMITNITNDDPQMTIKIALAHLMENPRYYTILKRVGL